MGYNLNEIIELAKFSTKFNGITGINFQPLSETTPQTKDLWVKDIERLDKVINELISMKKKGFPILNSISNLQRIKIYFRKKSNSYKQPCTLGYRNLFIDQYGDVSLCGNGFPSIGNMANLSAKEIYFSGAARKQRQSIRNCKKLCLGTCHVRKKLRDKIDLFKYLFMRNR